MKSVMHYISSLKAPVFIVAMAGCIDKYETPPSKYAASYLVVDGYLDAKNNSAQIKLSRTLELSNNSSLPIETGAVVTIEDENGTSFSLIETKDGFYEGGDIVTNAKSKYRLYITTSSGRKYSSAYEPVLIAPPLDSVTWKPDENGVHIYVNSHDEKNSTRYYKWNFTEVWEYNVPYYSYFIRQGNVAIPRYPDKQIYFCWLTQENTDILVGTTERLTSDILSQNQVTFIEKGDLKIGRIYSILVKQRALTEESYNYWLQLQKSTENLGGLFDPLPSQVLGNMQSEDDQAEPVLGSFSVSTVEEKRLFIQFAELPDNLLVVYQKLTCEKGVIDKDKLYTLSNQVLLDPLSPPGGEVTAYTYTSFECGDCTARGGSTTKPDFWIR